MKIITKYNLNDILQTQQGKVFKVDLIEFYTNGFGELQRCYVQKRPEIKVFEEDIIHKLVPKNKK